MNYIPDIPISWHNVGVSRDFSAARPTLVKIKNKEFVIYRDSKNKLRAISSRCPHMGANLCTGKIEGDHIVCPFHHWKFDTDGKCISVPASDFIPENAYLLTYPIVERHGIVCLFYGGEATFELPFFRGVEPEDFFSDARCFEVYQEGSWYIVPSNAFDIQHFIHVHGRTPIGKPKITYPDEHSAQITLSYEIMGRNFMDRMTRKIFGKIATLDFTTYAGNLIFAVTHFGPFTHYMMIFIQTTATGSSVSKIYTFSPGAKKGAWYRALKNPILGILGKLSQIFFNEEAVSLKHAYIDPARLHPNDSDLLEYFNWLNAYHKLARENAKTKKEVVTPESQRTYIV